MRANRISMFCFSASLGVMGTLASESPASATKPAVAGTTPAKPAAAATTTWEIDPVHSQVGFTVRHLMVTNVPGKFGKFSGAVVLHEKDITKSSVEVEIETASIDTANADRDKHLRADDFFDVEKFPKLTFKSTKIRKTGKGLQVTGDLTIRDVTKPVVLQVEGPTKSIVDPWGNTKRGASASAVIKRDEFGLKWNRLLETGGAVVGNDVRIQLELQLVLKKAAEPAAE